MLRCHRIHLFVRTVLSSGDEGTGADACRARCAHGLQFARAADQPGVAAFPAWWAPTMPRRRSSWPAPWPACRSSGPGWCMALRAGMKRRRSGLSWPSTLRGTQVQRLEIDPREFGMARCRRATLPGGDAKTNLAALLDVFEGRDRGAHLDALLLQSGLALDHCRPRAVHRRPASPGARCRRRAARRGLARAVARIRARASQAKAP